MITCEPLSDADNLLAGSNGPGWLLHFSDQGGQTSRHYDVTLTAKIINCVKELIYLHLFAKFCFKKVQHLKSVATFGHYLAKLETLVITGQISVEKIGNILRTF